MSYNFVDKHVITPLAKSFRKGIEQAQSLGEFQKDIYFYGFPARCCGDASYLLAEYFHQKGIESIWVSNERGDWSHAWLVIKDDRVKTPILKRFTWPKELQEIVKGYGADEPEKEHIITGYTYDDIKDGLIVDITGDQFNDYDKSVYVGKSDTFHDSFDFIQANDYEGLNGRRLSMLYEKIVRQME